MNGWEIVVLAGLILYIAYFARHHWLESKKPRKRSVARTLMEYEERTALARLYDRLEALPFLEEVTLDRSGVFPEFVVRGKHPLSMDELRQIDQARVDGPLVCLSYLEEKKP